MSLRSGRGSFDPKNKLKSFTRLGFTTEIFSRLIGLAIEQSNSLIKIIYRIKTKIGVHLGQLQELFLEKH